MKQIITDCIKCMLGAIAVMLGWAALLDLIFRIANTFYGG